MCGREVVPLHPVLLVRQEALLALLCLHPFGHTSSLGWVPFLHDVLVRKRLLSGVGAHGRLAVLMRRSGWNLRWGSLMETSVCLEPVELLQ